MARKSVRVHKPTTSPPSAESLLTMGDASQSEGDSGTINMVFSLVRGADLWGTILFDYETVDGTAEAGTDYTAISGSGSITAGQTVNFNVPIIGDTQVEPDETLSLRVFNVRYQ